MAKSQTMFGSAARTASPTKVTIGSGGATAVVVVVDVTAIVLTPLLTVNIRGLDAASGKEWLILASAVLGAVGTTVMQVSPGLVASAGVAANAVVPATIVIEPSHGDADSITYSVGVHFSG